MNRRLFSLAIIFSVSVAATFLFSAVVHAQTAVTGLTNQSALSCLIGSDTTNIPNIPNNQIIVPLLISPNNNIYSLKGSYALAPVNCGDLTAAQCQILKNGVNGAIGDASGRVGFPQENADSANTLSIEVGHFKGDKCSPSWVCEQNFVKPNGNGTYAVYSTIYIDEDAISNETNLVDGSAFAPFSNINVIQSVIVHEMGHSFGLGDGYAFENFQGILPASLPGTMADEELPYFYGYPTSSMTWDPTAAAAIIGINTMNAIQFSADVNNLFCINGVTGCPNGSSLTFTADTNGWYSLTCVTRDAADSSIDYNGYCDCNPDNGSAPYCVEQDGTTVAPPPGTCSAAPSVTANATDGCSCTATGPSCYDSSGNATVSPPENWCPAGTIPSDTVCACYNGVASCNSNTFGTPVAIPDTFTCEVPTTVSPTSQGGYECTDETTCEYNEQGGPFSDDTCDDACGN